MSKPLRVLVIDDSASVRQAMTAILNEDPEIEVIAAAADPFAAARYMHHPKIGIHISSRFTTKAKSSNRRRSAKVSQVD